MGYLDGHRDAAPVVGDSGAAHRRTRSRSLHGGRVVARYAKHHLPNYGVFDEYRYFVPGDALAVVRLNGIDVAAVICEDLWQDGGPVAVTRTAEAGLLIVINGSPIELAKDDQRLELCQHAALLRPAARWRTSTWSVARTSWCSTVTLSSSQRTLRCSRVRRSSRRLAWTSTSVTASQLGARTGNVTVDEPGGDRMTVSRSVVSDEPVPPYDPLTDVEPMRLADEAEVYAAIVTGLRDYVRKNGFRSVVLGLSGGIDSAVTAALAVDALGSGAVYGVSMPSSYSSSHSRDDAADLARRTGLRYSTIAIAPMVEAFLNNM